jgi:hypothetical protein
VKEKGTGELIPSLNDNDTMDVPEVEVGLIV